MPKQKEYRLRAKRNWRLKHQKHQSEYNKWYYENFTKAKRAALRNRLAS